MEKKITDDHHQPSSSSVSGRGDSRPSLKIRIRISPEMRKQLLKWDDKEEIEVEAVKEEINVKSEAKEEEEEVIVVPKVVKELIKVHHQTKQELVDCSSFELKLEATKRKFHDSYQQIANAKRQRRIQVIDPWNLPPQPAAPSGGTSSKLAVAAAGTAKSRILNVILSKKKKTNNKNRNNLFSASRSTTLLKPSYIC